MSAEYAGYNPLNEDQDDRYTTRPGLVYVTTKTPDVTTSKSKTASATTNSADTDKQESAEQASDENQPTGTDVNMEEPQCEIIVHTTQMEPPRTQYASDHFSMSLFVTICCFLPFGIVGLVQNHESRLKAVGGDYDGAVAYSRSSFKYALAGCIIGTVCYTGFAIFSLSVLILTLMGKAP